MTLWEAAKKIRRGGMGKGRTIMEKRTFVNKKNSDGQRSDFIYKIHI